MRVTGITTVVVNAKLRNWVFVKVTTDQDGLVGWGEATLEFKTRAVVGAVEDLAPLVVGQDPFRLEWLWQRMHRGQFFKQGVIGMSALSGIDMALHDIKAQALGVPLYDLLGGRVRDHIRCYDHLGGGAASSVYGTADPDDFAAAAARSVADGYTALKVLAVPIGGPLPDATAVRGAARVMAAIREAVGDDVEVMVDLHGRTTPRAAVQFARALEPFRPWFFEEPCQPEDIPGLREVAEATTIPIATGERLIARAQFRDVLATRAVAVLQPDVCHVGGPSEVRRIAALAETSQVVLAPHNPLGPIATRHNLHLAAATPNWLIQEHMRSDVPWRDEVVSEPMVVRDGTTAIPVGPGLGVRVDERAAARHPYEPEPQLASVHLVDGMVADW